MHEAVHGSTSFKAKEKKPGEDGIGAQHITTLHRVFEKLNICPPEKSANTRRTVKYTTSIQRHGKSPLKSYL